MSLTNSVAYEYKSYSVSNLRIQFIRFGMVVQVTIDSTAEAHNAFTKNAWCELLTTPFLPKAFQYHVCPLSDYNPELVNFQLQMDGVIKMRPQNDISGNGLIRCGFMYICDI